MKKKKKSVALQEFLPLKVSVKAAFYSELHALDEKTRASRLLLSPGEALHKMERERKTKKASV